MLPFIEPYTDLICLNSNAYTPYILVYIEYCTAIGRNDNSFFMYMDNYIEVFVCIDVMGLPYGYILLNQQVRNYIVKNFVVQCVLCALCVCVCVVCLKGHSEYENISLENIKCVRLYSI